MLEPVLYLSAILILGIGMRYPKQLLLWLCLPISFAVFLNLGELHGRGQQGIVRYHLHDFFHYYLGAKYFDQLGYTELYKASVHSLSEEGITQLDDPSLFLRDQHDYSLIKGAAFSGKDGPVVAEPFSEDIVFLVNRFRAATGDNRYLLLFQDRGYNGSPFLSMVLGSVADLVPLNDETLPVLLAFDPLVFFFAFLAVCWGFGLTGGLLFLNLVFLFPSHWDWIGGSFGRYLWLFGTALGCAGIARRNGAAAGIGIGLGTLFQGFPIFYAIIPTLAFIASLARFRERKGELQHLFLFGLSTLLVIGSGIAFTEHHYERSGKESIYKEWFNNSQFHSAHRTSNSVGLIPALTFDPKTEVEALIPFYTENIYDPEKFGLRGSEIPDISRFWNDVKREVLEKRASLLVGVLIVFWLYLAYLVFSVPLTILFPFGIVLVFFSMSMLSNYYLIALSLFPLGLVHQGRSSPYLLSALLVILFAVEELLLKEVFSPERQFSLMSIVYGLFFFLMLVVLGFREKRLKSP